MLDWIELHQALATLLASLIVLVGVAIGYLLKRFYFEKPSNPKQPVAIRLKNVRGLTMKNVRSTGIPLLDMDQVEDADLQDLYSNLPHHVQINRNDTCPCGSGKKYKKCGDLNTEEHQRLMASRK